MIALKSNLLSFNGNLAVSPTHHAFSREQRTVKPRATGRAQVNSDHNLSEVVGIWFRGCKMIRYFVVMMCCSSILVGQENSASKDKETPEERRETIVFQAIADMVANRDQLLARYAVVLEGEESDLEAEKPRVFPMLVIRCVSKKHQYDYAAEVNFQSHLQFDDQDAIAGLRSIEDWHECVQFKGDCKVFYGPKRLGIDYRQVGKGEVATKAMDEMGLVVPRFDPFDDFVAYASMFLMDEGNTGSLEGNLLKHAKLESTEDLVGSEIATTWASERKGDQSYRAFIKFSQTNDYMPTEVAYKYPDPRDFSVAKFYWQKHKCGFLLPSRIEFAYPTFGRRVETLQYAFKLRWLVGDELPDSVFDFKSDPRDPLMNLFGIDYDKDGQPAKNPWKVPEDLYQFDVSKQK